MSKLPGKTAYSGRRRTTTRKSGFNSHPKSTGGEYKKEQVDKILLHAGQSLVFSFAIPKPKNVIYLGYGGYYKCESNVTIEINNPNSAKNLNDHYELPDWSKFGSMWKSDEKPKLVTISFLSDTDNEISIYGFSCGLIWSNHFDNARVGIMNNMHKLSPEGNIYTESGEVEVPDMDILDDDLDIIDLKSCNRCARFLPINSYNERNHLSFSNHCVARAPCTHGGFGKLTNVDTNEEVQLYHGYQLECRFCKKYEVNAALNPQRTAAQMKEDGQRRMHFELLLTELRQMSPQLSYRHQTGGRELADDVWKRFDKKCFNCDIKLKSARKMHLDHTRPLALLWPLDETATALCPTCNSQKRDRYPSEFYSDEKLEKLAQITNLDVEKLRSPKPNHEVIKELLSKLDWLYDAFLMRPDLLKERDGKITSELIVKALDKALSRSKRKYEFSFVEEYNRRRDTHVIFDENEDLESTLDLETKK